MARINIEGSPEELERICIFLKKNNVDYRIVPDFKNHSKKMKEKYQKLIETHN